MKTEHQRGQFTFYASYFNAVDRLPKSRRAEAFYAIVLYALDGIEPESQAPCVHSMFEGIRPNIDNGRSKAEKACREKAERKTENKTEDQNKINIKSEEETEEETETETAAEEAAPYAEMFRSDAWLENAWQDLTEPGDRGEALTPSRQKRLLDRLLAAPPWERLALVEDQLARRRRGSATEASDSQTEAPCAPEGGG